MIDHVSRALLRIVKQSDPFAKAQRSAISEIFQALVSILPRIDTLVRRADFAMSDSITIQAVFIAVGPFFVTDPAAGKASVITSVLGGATALRGLTLSALSLIRSVSGT
jgi:cohesin loading factor subunit SCC2